MTVVVVIAVVVILLAVAGFLTMRRRPRQDDGLRSFRRHIDALSPEARREVQERVRRQDGGSRDDPEDRRWPATTDGPLAWLVTWRSTSAPPTPSST